MTKFVPDDQLETFKQASALWHTLVTDSENVTGDGGLVTRFEGSAIKVGEGMGLTSARASQLVSLLCATGNLTMVKRGNRAHPSIYRIGRPPDASAIRDTMRAMYHREERSHTGPLKSLDQRLVALTERVTALEERLYGEEQP